MTRGGLTTQKAEVLCLHCNNFVIPAVMNTCPSCYEFVHVKPGDV